MRACVCVSTGTMPVNLQEVTDSRAATEQLILFLFGRRLILLVCRRSLTKFHSVLVSSVVRFRRRLSSVVQQQESACVFVFNRIGLDATRQVHVLQPDTLVVQVRQASVTDSGQTDSSQFRIQEIQSVRQHPGTEEMANKRRINQ